MDIWYLLGKNFLDYKKRLEITICFIADESAHPGWDKVKVLSENLGATAVALVAPADTSLGSMPRIKIHKY